MKTGILVPLFLALLVTTVSAQVPDPNQSNVCLVTCPGGDAVAQVEVRDQFGQPMPGVFVILEIFGPIGTFNPCIPIPGPPAVQSDGNGVAEFRLPWGGAAANGVQVVVDFGQGPFLLFNNVPLAGFDLDGDGQVTPADQAQFNTLFGSPAPEANYDCNGNVDVPDMLAFQEHLGHSCDGVLAEGFQLPGNSVMVVAEVDSFGLDLEFSNQTQATLPMPWAQLAVEMGPRINATQTEVRLREFSAGSSGIDVPPTGEVSTWILSEDAEGDLPGVWNSDGTFSVGPVRWVMMSWFADSLYVAPAQGDTIDAVLAEGDTLECTMSGSIAYNATSKSYDFSDLQWTIQPNPGGSAFLSIEGGGTPQPMLIGNPPAKNWSQGGKCKRLCKQLCLLPVIICDSNGQNCGIDKTRRLRLQSKAAEILSGCCIRLSIADPVTINSTALNTWPANDPENLRVRRMNAKMRAIKNTNAWKTAKKKFKVPESKCVKNLYIKNANPSPDGGGIAKKPGDITVINVAHVDDTCKPPRAHEDRVLAHELGHTLNEADNTQSNDTCMSLCATGSKFGGSKDPGAMEELADNTACSRMYNTSKGKLVTSTTCCYEEKRNKRGIIKVK